MYEKDLPLEWISLLIINWSFISILISFKKESIFSFSDFWKIAVIEPLVWPFLIKLKFDLFLIIFTFLDLILK